MTAATLDVERPMRRITFSQKLSHWVVGISP